MGRRTIAGYKLTFHRSHQPDKEGSPNDLNGKSLPDILVRWARDKQDNGLIRVRDQRFIRVNSVTRFSKYVVVIDVMSGTSGEQGEVYDADSGAGKYSLTENDVPASSVRAILMSPK